jgi:hypothetical protein
MLGNVEQLMQQRDAAKNELEMARDTARTYYQKMVQAEAETSRIKTSMVAFRFYSTSVHVADGSQEDCDRFVLVLIDGDSMPVRLTCGQIFPRADRPGTIFMTDTSSLSMLSCRKACKAVRMQPSIFAQPSWII